MDFLEDVQAYVDFTDAESAKLRSLMDILGPEFPRISEHFYACILSHPSAHAVITGGPEQVERLKATLVDWMRSGLLGPHDQAFYERRAKIGRTHVKIGLPQQYMVTAIDVMRLDYRKVLIKQWPNDSRKLMEACDAVDKLFDIELAIMLQTYKSDSDERVRRGERLATIGQLAASIGHDLRNPLGVIESSLFILRKRVSSDERATKHIQKIDRQIRTCERIVSDLLDMARNSPPKYNRVDLAQLFENTIATTIVPDHVKIETHVADGLALEGDDGLLQQALVNLLVNAITALGREGGTVSLEASHAVDGQVRLRVADNGPGFEKEMLLEAFEPLVTTRAKGIGLGLALVRSIAQRHGGTASATNRDEGGAQVDVLVPPQQHRTDPGAS